jgi:AcrR family transcriptional regulator
MPVALASEPDEFRHGSDVSDAAEGRTGDSATRTRILQAALLNITLFGEDGVSMSRVAGKAGVSRGTVYRYFINREQLLEELGEHVRATYRHNFEAACRDAGSVEEKLERVIAGPDAETVEAVRRLRELQPAFTLAFLTARVRDFESLWREAFEDDFDRNDLAMPLEAFVQVVVRLQAAGTLLMDDDDTARQMLLTLWRAIQPAAPRPVASAIG